MAVEVGFLGLGIMGKAMATNLLRSGFKVTVWNRTLSKCDELVELGASVCETPAAVVKKCKCTIAILSDPSAACSVVFDKDGVLEQICSGKGYIDMSTVDADTSSKINEINNALCIFYLELKMPKSKDVCQGFLQNLYDYTLFIVRIQKQFCTANKKNWKNGEQNQL
ncbi:Glyoxylate/succinic semialdehyde reductase 1 [Morella rubra]|uniref:Glyoxylate/succinic semialdehyde reductase 1 n=1 Tax=Morella rubra TaxID=262757 RepID=A0A6A1WF70_9ROSI|nr:Glyoxylate/succinic semialdehyde reductase 1 [Morella rubra]